MMRRVRVALIGCGFYAQNHLHAWRDLRSAGADLVAVCDLDAGKAQAAGERAGIPWFEDTERLIDETRPELLDVATQMGSHRALARLAAERGLGCILQKPMAPNWDECTAIVNCAHEHGTFLAVHENFRFGTGMRRVRQVLAEGAIGQPNWARIAFRTNFDVYRTQPYFLTEERLAILDVGIHVLDLARVFLGEVKRVACETQTRNPKVRAEDTATMLLRHVSGAVSVVECTYESRRIPDPFPETLLEIEGSEGSIVVHRGERMTVTREGLAWDEAIGGPLLPWTSRPWHVSQEAVLHTCAHILEAFIAGRPAETSGEDNLKTYALCEAAYQAAATGTTARPPSWKPAGP